MNKIFSLFGVAALCAASASAASIVIFGTGLSDLNAVLPLGSIDSHYTLVSQPGATVTPASNPVRYQNGAYSAPGFTTSGFVSPNASGNAGAGGIYVYQTTFNIPVGFNPATASLTGRFATDNSGFVRLNNGPNLASCGLVCFTTGQDFSTGTGTGFVQGSNTFQVGVNNEGDPTAFRVEFTAAAVLPTGGVPPPVAGVPEPASAGLLGLGLAAMGFLARRRIV